MALLALVVVVKYSTPRGNPCACFGRPHLPLARLLVLHYVGHLRVHLLQRRVHGGRPRDVLVQALVPLLVRCQGHGSRRGRARRLQKSTRPRRKRAEQVKRGQQRVRAGTSERSHATDATGVKGAAARFGTPHVGARKAQSLFCLTARQARHGTRLARPARRARARHPAQRATPLRLVAPSASAARPLARAAPCGACRLEGDGVAPFPHSPAVCRTCAAAAAAAARRAAARRASMAAALVHPRVRTHRQGTLRNRAVHRRWGYLGSTDWQNWILPVAAEGGSCAPAHASTVSIKKLKHYLAILDRAKNTGGDEGGTQSFIPAMTLDPAA